MKNQSCLDSARSKKGFMLFKGMNTVPLLNQRKGPYYSTVSIQPLCSIKERVHTIQRYQFSLFTQLKKGPILFNGINSVSLLNQRKGPYYSTVSIQSLYSIKERVHTIQRYQFSLFTQLKKGPILFNGINSVSLLNQRKGPYYSKASIQSLCTIKERIHAIQRILYKQRWLCKRFLHLCLKTSSFFISSTSFFCAIRSMFLNEIWLDLWICASYNGSMKTYFIRWAYENVLLTSGLLKRTSYAGFIRTFFLRLF